MLHYTEGHRNVETHRILVTVFTPRPCHAMNTCEDKIFFFNACPQTQAAFNDYFLTASKNTNYICIN